MSRQSLAMGEGLVLRQDFPHLNRDWPRKEILCRDREFVVAAERAVGLGDSMSR